MHIMTKDGWKQLSPQALTPAPAPTASNGITAPYIGEFPSKAICDFHNSMKDKLVFFDDGIRMVYGKADRHVETDNAVAGNPIKYPPKGF